MITYAIHNPALKRINREKNENYVYEDTIYVHVRE